MLSLIDVKLSIAYKTGLLFVNFKRNHIHTHVQYLTGVTVWSAIIGTLATSATSSCQILTGLLHKDFASAVLAQFCAKIFA